MASITKVLSRFRIPARSFHAIHLVTLLPNERPVIGAAFPYDHRVNRTRGMDHGQAHLTIGEPSSGNRLNAVFLDHSQQPQRGATRLLDASLPI